MIKQGRKKLKRERGARAPSPMEDLSDEDDTSTYDAIIAARAEIDPSEEKMKLNARESLELAVKQDPLLLSEIGPSGIRTIGNSRGLGFASLAGQVQELQRQVAKLETKNTKLETKVCGLETEVGEQQGRMAHMGRTLENYRLIRGRFLSTYQRDHLPGGASNTDRVLITEANSWAHGGDVMVDADLYEGIGSRTDYHVFEALYGVAPQVVKSLKRPETISALNTHATVKASKYRTATDRFYILFQNSIQQFRHSGYDESYREGIPTSVTKAYWEYLDAIKTDVKWLPMDKPA